MKVAFDEHIAPPIMAALQALDGENALLRCEMVSARSYAVPGAGTDVPWIQRFAADGGRVVVSGDVKMRSKLHEQRALLEAGLIVFFMSRRWGQSNGYVKLSMLIRWWPVMLEVMRRARPGQFFEIPHGWIGGSVVQVTPPTEPRQKPGRKKRDSIESEASAPSARSAADQ